jgi:hypothetical protein
MSKAKYPSELNTRHIRIFAGDFAAIKEMAEDTEVTIADIVHEFLPGEAGLSDVPKEQIPFSGLTSPVNELTRAAALNQLSESEWQTIGVERGFNIFFDKLSIAEHIVNCDKCTKAVIAAFERKGWTINQPCRVVKKLVCRISKEGNITCDSQKDS